LLATYPDGAGGVDLQPFFDLSTVHELGHAFEALGDLRLPKFWLSEIFVNLALYAFVALQLPASLPTLETLPSAGAASRKLAPRMRTEGYSTLEEAGLFTNRNAGQPRPRLRELLRRRSSRLAPAAGFVPDLVEAEAEEPDAKGLETPELRGSEHGSLSVAWLT
jgi:hypothetical protein